MQRRGRHRMILAAPAIRIRAKKASGGVDFGTSSARRPAVVPTVRGRQPLTSVSEGDLPTYDTG
ncbi:hypothetical protein I553_3513 [Mycobacterium xenopi 4042]|uniref:Uncharacterized protein n=1 Tax=Mycobacterium xenopi 4042 TaxID=1299334 RepID=X7ZZG3_MYCXE|nr:hypothetical protein I553_3513 [Mycobacterium xenopi 4042]